MRHSLGFGLLLAIAISGCDRFGATTGESAAPTAGGGSSAEQALGGVAIVDLDEVAKRLGRDVSMVQSIQDKESEANAQLIALQHQMHELYETRRQELAVPPPQSLEEEQARQRELDDFQDRLGRQFVEAQQAARTEVSLYRQQVIGSYREMARPVCRDIAAARGLSIVLTKDDVHMLVYSDSVDITDAVTRELAKRLPPGGGPSEGGGAQAAAPPVTAQQPNAGEVR